MRRKNARRGLRWIGRKAREGRRTPPAPPRCDGDGLGAWREAVHWKRGGDRRGFLVRNTTAVLNTIDAEK